jgi:cytochrome c oxidase subunit 2
MMHALLNSPLIASTEIVKNTDDAFAWMFGISLFFLVGITVAMVLFAVKYRRSKSPKAADIHGNTKLEITWIVIPTLIVLFMFWKGYEGFLLMRSPPEDARLIDVEARQWAFSFTYPGTGVTTSELYVPAGEPIRCRLTAPRDDVVHSFYIPRFRTKEDCVPGRENYMWFQADGPGDYDIFCAEFCGKDHAKMITRLHVLPKEEFEAWLQSKIAERYKPIELAKATNPQSEEIMASDAEGLYKTYCASCHGPEGRGGLVEGARNFREMDGWKNGPSLVGIFRTLTEGIPDTEMRAFTNLSAWDRFALAHKVLSFSEGKERTASTQKELETLVEVYELDKQEAPPSALPLAEARDELLKEADGSSER